jgi:hypothetical protein
MYAVAPAPKKLEPLVAPAVRMNLVRFLRTAYKEFGVHFPEELVPATGKNGDDFNETVREILRMDWKENELGVLILANNTGMVHAYLRRDKINSTQNWFGGFLYYVAYPKDADECRALIENRLFFPDEHQIEQYKRCSPGISVAGIRVNTMQVSEWDRTLADRYSTDFTHWKNIFEALFDNLDFTDTNRYGQRMFDTIYDPYWQWTSERRENLEMKLKIIASSANTEEEVGRRVREELNYHFDTICMFLLYKQAFGDM